MSIEIVLHPVRGSRDELKKHLEQLGYQPCEHLWKWPKGTLNYHWFDREGHKSYDGVEANIAKPSKEDIRKLGPCSWVLHTRTRVAASPDDKEHQNKTIREARRKFGGKFYNDWYGTNKYTVTRPDGRDAISRATYLVYERVTFNLQALMITIPDGGFPKVKPRDSYARMLSEFMGTQDPVRILYNALVPFAVASLEHFFSQMFKILLSYDTKAKAKIATQSKKIEVVDLLAVRDGNKSVEDIIADWFSFQNIDSIHKAFSEWFSIDVWKILKVSKLPGNDIVFLDEAFNKIIEFRHGIIHRYDIDRELDRDQIVKIFETAIAVVEAFIGYLEKHRGYPIKEETVWAAKEAEEAAS